MTELEKQFRAILAVQKKSISSWLRDHSVDRVEFYAALNGDRRYQHHMGTMKKWCESQKMTLQQH